MQNSNFWVNLAFMVFLRFQINKVFDVVVAHRSARALCWLFKESFCMGIQQLTQISFLSTMKLGIFLIELFPFWFVMVSHLLLLLRFAYQWEENRIRLNRFSFPSKIFGLLKASARLSRLCFGILWWWKADSLYTVIELQMNFLQSDAELFKFLTKIFARTHRSVQLKYYDSVENFFQSSRVNMVDKAMINSRKVRTWKLILLNSVSCKRTRCSPMDVSWIYISIPVKSERVVESFQVRISLDVSSERSDIFRVKDIWKLFE